ncbi:MAG: hypothetical protein ABI307_11305 [Mycobacterium sp.]
MLNGWRTVPRRRVGRSTRLGVLVVGALAALVMGVVGCTSIIGGAPAVDTSAAPAYRSSVSASVSASVATSSIQESQRQQSMTTQAVRGACGRFASNSDDAIDTVNKYVQAFNSGTNIAATAGPAVDALNHSADEVAGAINEKLSTELRDAFNVYIDAARGVANAISGKAPVSVYNSRKDQLNAAREKGIQLCRAY